MKRILVGSRAFFSGMDGFRSKDHDYLELVENPTAFKWRREQSLRGVCTFQFKKEPPADMVRRTLDCGDALLVGKFLVPEVAQAIGATVVDILCGRHFRCRETERQLRADRRTAGGRLRSVPESTADDGSAGGWSASHKKSNR